MKDNRKIQGSSRSKDREIKLKKKKRNLKQKKTKCVQYKNKID